MNEICDKCYCQPDRCTCHIDRRLCGQPIRRSTTGLFHPFKITREEFVDDIQKSAEGWSKNLEVCGDPKESEAFPEEWAESLLAWMEIEVESEC